MTDAKRQQEVFTFTSILKGFSMPSQADDHILLSRRDFMFAAFLFPFLVDTSLADNKISVEGSISLGTESDFVILGGWVLLKKDLTDNLG
ncbi:MAG: hypothetical protein WAW02_00665 [Sideroxyarcus sp.]